MILGKNIIGLEIQGIASELGKLPINIDHLSGFNWETEMEINNEKYDNYKNLYIKKRGTPEKLIWEIFYSYIQRSNIL
jgi:predicted TIM-barrel fold metal-dependent hydrolase